MSLLPGAGTGQSKKVTGRALITFKLSFALSPTSYLFSTASHFAPKLDAALATLATQSKLPRWHWNPARATSPVWAGKCLLCWRPWQGSPQLGSTPRSHSAPGSEPTAPLCGSPHSTCRTSHALGCFFSLDVFFPPKKKELKHQNTELTVQTEAPTPEAAINAPFVSTQGF